MRLRLLLITESKIACRRREQFREYQSFPRAAIAKPGRVELRKQSVLSGSHFVASLELM